MATEAEETLNYKAKPFYPSWYKPGAQPNARPPQEAAQSSNAQRFPNANARNGAAPRNDSWDNAQDVSGVGQQQQQYHQQQPYQQHQHQHQQRSFYPSQQQHVQYNAQPQYSQQRYPQQQQPGPQFISEYLTPQQQRELAQPADDDDDDEIDEDEYLEFIKRDQRKERNFQQIQSKDLTEDSEEVMDALEEYLSGLPDDE